MRMRAIILVAFNLFSPLSIHGGHYGVSGSSVMTNNDEDERRIEETAWSNLISNSVVANSAAGSSSKSAVCSAGGITGNCMDWQQCNYGIPVPRSPGCERFPSEVMCCVPVPGGTFRPRPSDTSNSYGTSVTIQQQIPVDCILDTKCTGAVFHSLCPGPFNIKGCSAELESSWRASVGLNKAQFDRMFPSVANTDRGDAIYPYLNHAAIQIALNAGMPQAQCYKVAAFSAQVSVETVELKYFTEIADGSAYNGRSDLGNIYPGDGPRFKGRGALHLTGRSNYDYYGSLLDIDLIGQPENVAYQNLGFMTSVMYWFIIFTEGNDATTIVGREA